jgi:hypothetical protein
MLDHRSETRIWFVLHFGKNAFRLGKAIRNSYNRIRFVQPIRLYLKPILRFSLRELCEVKLYTFKKKSFLLHCSC